MSISDEIRRLETGSTAGERPGGIGTVTFRGSGIASAAELRSRVVEVLGAVLSASSKGWPADTEWAELLPEWFVDACAAETSQAEAELELDRWRRMTPAQKEQAEATEPWELLDWVHWLKPSERCWEFWECRTEGDGVVALRVSVDAWPFAYGALEWLLRAAGVSKISLDA